MVDGRVMIVLGNLPRAGVEMFTGQPLEYAGNARKFLLKVEGSSLNGVLDLMPWPEIINPSIIQTINLLINQLKGHYVAEISIDCL